MKTEGLCGRKCVWAPGEVYWSSVGLADDQAAGDAQENRDLDEEEPWGALFLQTDPIGYGDGMNWYAYTHGDPVNYTDPSGLAICNGFNFIGADGFITYYFGQCTNPEPTSSSGQGSHDNTGGGAGANGRSGRMPQPPPQGKTPASKITCNTVLPNGKTVGQVVQNSVSNIEDAAGPYDIGGLGELGAFAATVGSRGPIDFKNNLGPDPTGALGAAGNFAYGAIASGIGLSQIEAEVGAGAYALKNDKFNVNNPGGEDNSAAQNLPAGYASKGCGAGG